MDLASHDRMGKSVAVVYEVASADILKRTICLEDGSKLQIHNINLRLIDQPDLSNSPKIPLDYRNELGTGITLK